MRAFTKLVAAVVVAGIMLTVVSIPAFAYYGPTYPSTSGWDIQREVTVNGSYLLFTGISVSGDMVHAAAAGSNEYYFRSVNRGVTWTKQNIGSYSTNANADVTANGTEVYFIKGANPIKVYRSQNSGDTWTEIGSIAGNHASLTNYPGSVGISYINGINAYMRTIVDDTVSPESLPLGAADVNLPTYIESVPSGKYFVAYIDSDGVLITKRLTAAGVVDDTDPIATVNNTNITGLAYGGDDMGMLILTFTDSNTPAYHSATRPYGSSIWQVPVNYSFVSNLVPAYGDYMIYGVSSSATNDVVGFVPGASSGTTYMYQNGVNKLVPFKSGDTTYLGAATAGYGYITHDNDIQAPAGTLNVPEFASGNFPIVFTGVADDWNVSGTNPTNYTYFVNGVSKIEVEYSINGGADWIPLNPPIVPANSIDNSWDTVLTSPSDGEYKVRGTLYDTADNHVTTAVGTVTVDRTYPTLSINVTGAKHGDFYIERPTVTLVAADSVSGINHTEYKIDTGSWHTYTGPFQVSDGRPNIYARTFNNAGNMTETDKMVWIDTINPTSKVTEPAGTTVSPDPDGLINLGGETYDENNERADIYLNGEFKATATGTKTIKPGCYVNVTGWADKTNLHIEVKATDQAGHTKSASKDVTLKTQSVNPDDPDDPNKPTEGTMKDWYFAEGNTMANFDEYITIQNFSKDKPANVTITYMLGNGKNMNQAAVIAPHSRTTVSVKNTVPLWQDVSTKVSSDIPIVCERPIYFRNFNGRTEGTNAEGAMEARGHWLFAEGCTRNGFDTYLTIMNPGSNVATVNITYMLGNGQNIPQQIQVAPTSRMTMKVWEITGRYNDSRGDVSMEINSDHRIVCERPIYFTYNGSWAGAHDALGSNITSKSWYFAEGATYDWIHTYLCLQNTSTATANVSITYLTGSGEKVVRNKQIPAKSRATVFVNNDLGWNKDVATTITSDQPIVAERPVYFARDGYTGGHNTMGAYELNKRFFLAEGTTRRGYQEWITVINDSPYWLNLYTVYTTTDGKQIRMAPAGDLPDYTAPPYSRLTINVNADIAKVCRDYGISAEQDLSVELIGNQPMVVERPLYFNTDDGRRGGHDAMAVPAVGQ